MASSSESIFGVVTSQVVVPPGATNAVFVDVVPKEGAVLLKYFSGGTLEIHGSITGSTLPGATLAPLIGTGYILSTSEVISLAGPTRFYLMATGSTAVACLLRGLTAPGFNDPNAIN